MKNIFLMVLLTAFYSCGGNSNGYSSNNTPAPPQEEQTDEGTFRGVANATNPDIASSSNAFQMKIEGDLFEVEIFGGGPATTHIQTIQSGTRCPTMDDDKNQDGVIDATEGAAVYGSPILALDSDLTSNGGVYPFTATYRYTQSASLSAILGNLKVPALNINGKVLTIQGVPGTTVLPATVQGGKANFPVACGVIPKVEDVPAP